MADYLNYTARSNQNEEHDLLIYEGMNSKGVYSKVARLSDGKLLTESFWDLDGHIIFTENGEGTIAELVSYGVPYHEIYKGAREASCRVEPAVKNYK
jgi:hypothetical protein